MRVVLCGILDGKPAAHNMSSMDVREQLKGMRLECGLSQTALGSKIGLSQSHVSHIEGGRRMPSADIIVRWARACGYEWNAARQDPPEWAQWEAVADALSQLPESKRMYVVRMVALAGHVPEQVLEQALGILDLYRQIESPG